MSDRIKRHPKTPLKDTKISVSHLQIIPSSLKTVPDKSFKMDVRVSPEIAQKMVSWTSDNPDVVAITPVTGRAKTKGVGVATIKAQCHNKVASATIKVFEPVLRFALKKKDGGESYENATDGCVIKPFQDHIRMLNDDKCFEMVPFAYDGTSLRKMDICPIDIDVTVSNPEVLDYKKSYTVDGNNKAITRLTFAPLKDGTSNIRIAVKDPLGVIYPELRAFHFTVEINGMTGVILEKRVLRLYKGITEKLKAKVIPENSERKVGWSFSNPSVITACSDGFMNGMLTGKEPGEASVTAYTKNAALKAFVSVCELDFALLSPERNYVNMPNKINVRDGNYLIEGNSITIFPFLNFKGLSHPLDFSPSYILYEIEKPELLSISVTSFHHANAIFNGTGPALKVKWIGKGRSNVTIMIKKPVPGRGVIIHEQTVTFVIE